MDDKLIPKWMNKAILDPSHHGLLETSAAIHEFSNKLPRKEAEAKAYQDYIKDHREKAAAHHLDGQRSAEAVGDKETAAKHNRLYNLHLKALGVDEIGPVPKEIQTHIDDEGKQKTVKFKAHKADLFALQDDKGSEDKDKIEKAENSSTDICLHTSKGKRCKNHVIEKKKIGNHLYCFAHQSIHTEIQKTLDSISDFFKTVSRV